MAYYLTGVAPFECALANAVVLASMVLSYDPRAGAYQNVSGLLDRLGIAAEVVIRGDYFRAARVAYEDFSQKLRQERLLRPAGPSRR